MADPDRSLFQRSLNVYRLQELVDALITGVSQGSRFVFSAALLKRLHKVVAEGQLDNNGDFRNHDVAINGSPHRPCSWVEVETQVESMCRYVNENWDGRDLVHLAAFVIWRINYIHPFSDGNGRTSRAACWLILCARHGKHLPGRNTVLTQIMNARDQYCLALRHCDEEYIRTGSIDHAIEPMVQLIGAMLITQLADAV
jgi:Fic family protein